MCVSNSVVGVKEDGLYNQDTIKLIYCLKSTFPNLSIPEFPKHWVKKVKQKGRILYNLISDTVIKDNNVFKILKSLQLTFPISSKIAPNNSAKQTPKDKQVLSRFTRKRKQFKFSLPLALLSFNFLQDW